MPEKPNIAVVIDAMPAYAGAERVLASALELYPDAPIYTSVYAPSAFIGTSIANHKIHTSWIQRVPGGLVHYRKFLPLLPMAFEQFDLSAYDLVLSFSYAVAHGVICRPDQLHISYTFTPLRYAWQNSHEYFQHRLVSLIAKPILHSFRTWDHNAASRVDQFAAISKWTADCIRRAYQRESKVIYPPVEVERFRPLDPRGDYFVALSRLVQHKRMDLIVDAFSRLGLPLIVIGVGPERKRLEARAAGNVKFLGWQSDEVVAEILNRARALVHAAAEDFGLVLVEAQAAGCPVIAFGRGAARETILEGKTGLLFSEPTLDSLIQAVECFIEDERIFNRNDILENASRFGKKRFQCEFAQMIEREWYGFAGSVASMKSLIA
ncbi:MAG: glycosyltransferase [Chloroflexi bacterium]|nr:glycosyltransferase [Chloroflexota bacterium]